MNQTTLGTRRPQKLNHSFVVNLPKFWVDAIGLSKGDILHFSMKPDGVLILKLIKEDGSHEHT